MDWRDFFLKRDSKFFVSLLHLFLQRDVRRDEIFGLVHDELIFVDVISGRVEDLGRNVDEIQQKQEEGGSSHREEDWKLLSLTRKTGSSRRRVETWLSWKALWIDVVYNEIARSLWSTYGCHDSSIRATRFIGDLWIWFLRWNRGRRRAKEHKLNSG